MLLEYKNGYAFALFKLAEEEKKTLNIKVDAKILIEVLEDNLSIFDLWSSKSLNKNEIENISTLAFKNIDPYLINFINLVIFKNKSHYIIPVLKMLISLINKSLGIKEGIAYTTIALSPKQVSELTKRVAKILGFEPVLINKIDLSLVSGFKIKVGDIVIEDSIISRLNNIKQTLIKGGK